MLPRERNEAIKKIAEEEKKIYVSKLSEKFNVSKETIRRDLDKLEECGIIIRSHGGAILKKKEVNNDNIFINGLRNNIESIKSIQEKTVDFIKECNTVIADYSTIVLEVLKLLRNRDDVTVITNSVSALQELSQSNLNFISTGGCVNRRLQSLQGTITQEAIKSYYADIALVDCNGIDISNGILEQNEAEAEIKRIMIKQAKKVILLADKTIFDTTSFVKLFDFTDIDYIITDKKPREEWIKLFQSYNIEVIY